MFCFVLLGFCSFVLLAFIYFDLLLLLLLGGGGGGVNIKGNNKCRINRYILNVR